MTPKMAHTDGGDQKNNKINKEDAQLQSIATVNINSVV